MPLNVYTTRISGVSLPKTRQGWNKFYAFVEAAEKLFAESGFSDVSISDICREAGTAVGTFYIYFETKADIYRYLVESYGNRIRQNLAKDIEGCTTRAERERAGIKSFVKLAVEAPTLYSIIWGSLAVDKQLFENYYVSFAKIYARSLHADQDEVKSTDLTTLSYALMGISSFLGLRAIFEKMSEEEIDQMIDGTFMPMLREGVLKEI
ncbi:MAG: TetR/AcrR family transcriptional regulator [Lachnospiraceae bacterium]|nr:TetR/AcrR family transcriptional regulator [Lachnospiraceae bacterium]